jgi:hypothetical protein
MHLAAILFGVFLILLMLVWTLAYVLRRARWH